jgi:hypothetical protein
MTTNLNRINCCATFDEWWLQNYPLIEMDFPADKAAAKAWAEIIWNESRNSALLAHGVYDMPTI